MAERPHVLLSCAMSVDGYIDDASPKRLLLSNDEDFDRVDEERAGCDALLVGANTIRRDNPRLLVRSEARRAGRRSRGLSENPLKVTLTSSANLDPTSRFFTSGDAPKLVYCPSPVAAKLTEQLGDAATVIDAGDPLTLQALLSDLAGRGVRRLMVEGGSTMHTRFLAEGLADELHLVVAPFFVGDPTAPRFVGPGTFAHDATNRMELAGVRSIDDVVLLQYRL